MKLTPYSPPTPQPSKIGHVSLDRNRAQSAKPSDGTGTSEDRIKVYTYFTKVVPASDILYTGDRMWARVILTLETAGPVAIGDAVDITPVLSGKGQLLETDVPTVLDVAKGNRIWIAATSINRVKVEIAPYPWLETITGLAGSILGAIRGTVAGAASLLGSKL